MKRLLLIISLLILSIGFSQQEYNVNDLIEMDNGLLTVKFSDEPITGKVYGYFGEVKPLKKVYMGKILNGKQEGRWKSYHNNTGRKSSDDNYKNGLKNGLSTLWWENGQKMMELTFKDGKEDGLSAIWYENGQKKSEITFKDGKKDGLITVWYENGQKQLAAYLRNSIPDGIGKGWYANGNKEYEKNFKDGQQHGLTILWDENGSKYEKNFKDGQQHGLNIVWDKYGNKIMESTFKDGYFVSLKEWNSDGSLKKLKPFQNEDGSIKKNLKSPPIYKTND